MKKIGLCMLLLGIAAGSIVADVQKSDKPATALPPHPLDEAFQNVDREGNINTNLLRNDLFKKAVSAALRAKQDQEERFQKNPNLAAPTPEQAARVELLEVLTNGTLGNSKTAKG